MRQIIELDKINVTYEDLLDTNPVVVGEFPELPPSKDEVIPGPVRETILKKDQDKPQKKSDYPEQHRR